MARKQPLTRTVTLRLRNTRPDAQMLYLEPWGSEYPMPPGAVFEVVAQGPEATPWRWRSARAR